MPRYWLLKTEAGCFSIDDLAAQPKQTTAWDGVRNYQARNFLREMQPGDKALFYHSGGSAPGIAGLTVSTAERIPTFGQAMPSACARSIAFCAMSAR